VARTSKLCELPSLVARVTVAVGERAAVRTSASGFALVEHVWHLAEIETEAFQIRLARLASEPAPWLADFDGDRLAVERGYIARSVAGGVRAFVRARAATVAALGRIRGAAWLRGGMQEHVGYVTLGELPERMLGHDKAHAGELADLMAAIRPGHALIGELRRWCGEIVDAPASPCNRRARQRPRASLALSLARVQRALAANVAAGEHSTAALGRALGLSPRTLQRRLAAHGLTVQCLVQESVRALAIDRIRAGADWRAAAIDLGFSDPRAFARAFKRWTRVTPSAFQRAPAVTGRGCG
jgi:AraC-like DNA-binding protein